MKVTKVLNSNILSNYVFDSPILNFNLKKYLEDFLDISPRQFNKLKDNNSIFIDDKCYTNMQKMFVFPNSTICVDFGYLEDNSNILNSKFKDYFLNIVYEDDFLLICNKDLNIPVMQVIHHPNDTFQNILKDYFDNINLHKKIRILNRLDSDTTGLIVVPKSSYVHEILQRQIKENIFEKKYLALTTKLNLNNLFANNLIATSPSPDYDFRIDKKIFKDEISKMRKANLSIGKDCITDFKILKSSPLFDILEAKLLTGRTHQIRAHLSSIDAFIFGDKTYFSAISQDLYEQCIRDKILDKNTMHLHSYYLKFIHPVSKKIIELKNYPNWF